MSLILIILAGAAVAAALLFVFLRRRGAPPDLSGEEGRHWPPVPGRSGGAPAALERKPPTGKLPEVTERVDARGGLRLQGNLTQTPLHDLLQYLSLGRKSGILEVTSGRRTGRMVMRDGKVCKSSYRGKEAMEAAFLLMDLPDGDFE